MQFLSHNDHLLVQQMYFIFVVLVFSLRLEQLYFHASLFLCQTTVIQFLKFVFHLSPYQHF